MDQILGLLLNSVLKPDTMNTVAQSTGVTTQEATNVVTSALPSLVSSLSQTASNQQASNNLMNLVSQVNDNNTVAQNTSIGNSLLSTIMGGSNNTNSLVSSVSNNTGVSNKKVNSILTMVAPLLIVALIKMFSNAKKKATQSAYQTNNQSVLTPFTTTSAASNKPSSGVNLSDGLDMSDIMALMGGLTQSNTANNNTSLSNGLSVSNVLGLLGGLTSTNNSNNKPSSGFDLSDGLDMTDILGLMGAATSTNTSNKKKKKTSGVDLSDGLDLGDIIGLMMNKK